MDRFVWGFIAILVVLPLIAVFSGYIIATTFIGAGLAFPILFVSMRTNMSVGNAFGLAFFSLASIAIGLCFVQSGPPAVTNDDRYQKLLGETAYSCQSAHYDKENCRIQKQGLDDVAKWLNEQKR